MLQAECDCESTESPTVEEEQGIEEDQVDDAKDVDKYGLCERDRSHICAAFTLLDSDGDGILSPRTMGNVLVLLGREPVQENMDDMLKYTTTDGCDNKTGMTFDGFYEYLANQLVDTDDEATLRDAFAVFGSVSRMNDPVPPGWIDMSELRFYLKHKGNMLTDDEIDYLWAEEDNWMLDEKLIEADYLINKIMMRFD